MGESSVGSCWRGSLSSGLTPPLRRRPDSEVYWDSSSPPLLPLTGVCVCRYSLLLPSLPPCRTSREMLGEVLRPVLETVSEAPADSPLRDVDLNQITDYLLHLCAPQEPNVRGAPVILVSISVSTGGLCSRWVGNSCGKRSSFGA